MADQKLVLNVEIKKGDHVFMYSMPIGSSLQSAYDAIIEIQQLIVDMSKKGQEQEQANASAASNNSLEQVEVTSIQ